MHSSLKSFLLRCIWHEVFRYVRKLETLMLPFHWSLCLCQYNFPIQAAFDREWLAVARCIYFLYPL